MRYEPVHFTIVALDVVASGSRDDQLTLRMRNDLRGIVSETLARQSIDWAALDRTDLGDGFRLAIPADISPSAALDPFVSNLESALREHRKAASEAARLRLRMAVHQGLVHRDGGAWAGAPMILCARLLDSAPLRQVMNLLPDADLAVIVSESIYDSVVRHGYGLDPRSYQQVTIQEKETTTTAWLHVSGRRPPFAVDQPAQPASANPAVADQDGSPAQPITFQNVAMGDAHVGAQIGQVTGPVYLGPDGGSR